MSNRAKRRSARHKKPYKGKPILQAPCKLIGDFAGLLKVCGPRLALKWLLRVGLNMKGIVLRGDLQPADRAMGSGPFRVRSRSGVQFRIMAPSALSGIREMYVRDCYLKRGVLSIHDGDIVIDLGANVGNFTNLALAHGPHVGVLAVEPNAALNQTFKQSLELNEGFMERTTLLSAFLGEPGDKQKALMGNPHECPDPTWIGEMDLIRAIGSDKIDFLKCDIEGGEFSLLAGDSVLLKMTSQIAVEIHSFAGDVDALLGAIKSSGFRILSTSWASDGSCTALARKSN